MSGWILVGIGVLVIIALGGVVGAIQGEGYDLAEPGLRLDLRKGGRQRRIGEAVAATVSARSRAASRAASDAAGIPIGRARPGARMFVGALPLLLLGSLGALGILLPVPAGNPTLGWFLVAIAGPVAYLAGKSVEGYLVLRPDGVVRVGAWGSRNFVAWNSVRSVKVMAMLYPKTTVAASWTLVIEGTTGRSTIRSKVLVDSPGIADLAAALLAHVPAEVLGRNPDAAEALVAIATISGRAIPEGSTAGPKPWRETPADTLR